MKIVILSALGNEAVHRCVDSLLKTSDSADFDLFVLRERGFREKTLNAALSLIGTDDDLLLVGDDIEFTDGWLTALKQNEHNADIWGMCMLYPHTDKVQDCGYDLAEIHGRILLEPRERGRRQDQIEHFGWRHCDGVCGCFLYIRSHVFDRVHTFREEEGCNRWGEFIFIAEARKTGAHVGVVEHFLHHGGIGTKGHADKALSSTSYQVEKELWRVISERFVDPSWVRVQRSTAVESSLLADLRQLNQKVLIYGIGTVTEALLYHLGETAPVFTFATGLPEEAGVIVHGATVHHVKEIDPNSFALILITPLNAGDTIFREHFASRLPASFTGRVSAMMARHERDTIYYFTRDFVY